jgi:hypothetical protein
VRGYEAIHWCRTPDRRPTVSPQAKMLLPGGCTKGELTLIGQQQSLEFGKWLRERYVEQLTFLPAVYQARRRPCTLFTRLPPSVFLGFRV